MKNTFYRPSKTSTREFDSIVSKLRDDLSQFISGGVEETKIKDYASKLVYDHKSLEHNEEMAFWGLDEPQNIPSDARVDYFYMPSYIAVCFLVNVLLAYPQIANSIPEFELVLKKGLLGSTGRRFEGHGYNSFEGLLDTMELFVEVNMQKFVELYPDYCKEFRALFNTSMKHITDRYSQGNTCGSLEGDLTKRVVALIERYKGGVL